MMNSYVYLLNRNGQQAAQWVENNFVPTIFVAFNEKSWFFFFIRNKILKIYKYTTNIRINLY